MDRSIRSLADPVARTSLIERRRRIRHKLHTPVYASFNGPQTGMVVDLSELLDLHEEGFAVQTSQCLEVKRAVTVCLDLPETKSYIHSTGQVIWSDDSGRGGIQFSGLPEKSRQVLKEWLFANLMVSCANQASRTAQRAGRLETKSPEPAPVAKAPAIGPISSGSAIIPAVEAVRLVIRDIGEDIDTILQLVTERASSFTGASGAALAFLTDDKMICRARTGDAAPPLGVPVDVKHGLTGECVRTGVLVCCDDTENDSRVDPEVRRALGIGSLMAAPIMSGSHVIGLLEIFSARPRAFRNFHGTVLERLVELIPTTSREQPPSEKVSFDPLIGKESRTPESERPTSNAGSIGPVSLHATSEPREPVVVEQDARRTTKSDENALDEPSGKVAGSAFQSSAPRLLYRGLLGMAILIMFLVLGYVLAPVIDKRWGSAPQASQPSSGRAVDTTVSSQSTPATHSPTDYLNDLRNLAEQGNAEAQWQLGARYHNGEGVPRDDVQAMQWFRRAAEQGNVTAQATLGAYYWAGRGVPQDLTKAYFWSALALAQGDQNSKSRLEGLSTQMTPQEITAARQQAEAWIQGHRQGAKSSTN